MKTQQCNRLPLFHGPHSWHPDGDWVQEQYHNRYCNGMSPALDSFTQSQINLHHTLGIPYKYNTILSGAFLIERADAVIRNLRKQTRTRDRKITRLSKENRALKALLKEWAEGLQPVGNYSLRERTEKYL